jgi:hypothetical protein
MGVTITHQTPTEVSKAEKLTRLGFSWIFPMKKSNGHDWLSAVFRGGVKRLSAKRRVPIRNKPTFDQQKP